MELIKELKKKNYCQRDKSGKCSCFNCLDPGETGQFYLRLFGVYGDLLLSNGSL